MKLSATLKLLGATLLLLARLAAAEPATLPVTVPATTPATAPAAAPAAKPATAPAAAGDSGAGFDQVLAEARAALDRWDFQTAEAGSKRLLELVAADPAGSARKDQVHLFLASFNYFKGDYAATHDELLQLGAASTEPTELPDLFKRSERLIQEWDKSKERQSERFIVRYRPGKDAVLVEPALATLEAAYQTLSADLKVTVEAPILVEFYPSFEGFQAATNLSEEALQKSGTIAVCKYRRLMLNTPRNLLRGYDYRDTLSHELVHFLLYQKYANAIPIWLHEGLAKYEEERWRGGSGGELSPTQKSLLASALSENTLISFDRMSPSFAYLETPAQGQLAFAEVTTVISYLVKQGGWDLVFKLCHEQGASLDYRTAIRRATGQEFERFWSDWIEYVRGQGFAEIPGMEITALEIRKGEEGFEDTDEDVDEKELSEGEEWRLVRLGDLLRDRGHVKAAALEYARARELSPYSLRVLNKIGIAAILQEDYQAALEPLEQAIALYGNYSGALVNLGHANFELGRFDQAAAAYEKALDVNPFNPLPYQPLMSIYHGRGDRERVKKLARDFFIISGKNQDLDDTVPPFEIKDDKGGSFTYE